MFKEDVASAPGSVTQVRECTMELMKIAKTYSIPIFLVGHVTKEGAIAGPRMLEHMVDAVLYFEGDRKSTRLNSSHVAISYAVFCLKKKKIINIYEYMQTIMSV